MEQVGGVGSMRKRGHSSDSWERRARKRVEAALSGGSRWRRLVHSRSRDLVPLLRMSSLHQMLLSLSQAHNFCRTLTLFICLL